MPLASNRGSNEITRIAAGNCRALASNENPNAKGRFWATRRVAFNEG